MIVSDYPQKGFTIVELIITFFLITLIGTLIFSVLYFIKDNLKDTYLKSTEIHNQEKILSFISLGLKYLFINNSTAQVITYKKKSDFMNNRRDQIEFYSTYPNGMITKFKIICDENNLSIKKSISSDTVASISNIEEFKISFYKNDRKIDELPDLKQGKTIFDHLKIDIKIKDQIYSQKIRPFILY